MSDRKEQHDMYATRFLHRYLSLEVKMRFRHHALESRSRVAMPHLTSF